MGAKGKKKKLGLGSWIILVICAMVFCGSAGYLGLYAKDKLDSEKEFNELGDMRAAGLENLYAENNDFVGWIEVDGTRINYPVMQTPDNPEFYLHRDFHKQDSVSGTPFADATSILTGKYKTWNWVIYGHNMKFGTMFHDLEKFGDKEFWKEHGTFTFDTYNPEDGVQMGDYEIVTVARSRIKEAGSTEFKYYQYACYNDEETFNEFVEGIKREALYDTGITPEYGDQLVTLTTCAYHTNEGRFYIVGRKVN